MSELLLNEEERNILNRITAAKVAADQASKKAQRDLQEILLDITLNERALWQSIAKSHNLDLTKKNYTVVYDSPEVARLEELPMPGVSSGFEEAEQENETDSDTV